MKRGFTLLLLLCLFSIAALAQSTQTRIASALSKGFADYEKILGKPYRVDPPSEMISGESRFYKTAFSSQVIITQGVKDKAPGYVSVTFKKGAAKTWKDALKLVGLDGRKARLKKTNEYFTVSGVGGLKGGFKVVYWLPNNPDVDGLDMLQISH